MILKTSKFLGCCYSDEISELQFFGKKFNAIVEKENLILSFELMKGLDKEDVLSKIKEFTFFEFQDKYLQNRLLNLMQNAPNATKVYLRVANHSFAVKHLKITYNGFVIRMI